MKKLFLLTVAVLIGIAVNAQSQQMAVLNHDGEYSTFYGSGALRSAVDAAVAGDKITLSPGFFEDPGFIRKGLTIIGAGMSGNEVSCVSSLILESRLNDSEEQPKYRIENIKVNDRIHLGADVEAYIIKAQCGRLTGATPKIANIHNCDISEIDWRPQTCNIINSVIRASNYIYGSNPTFVNCIFTNRVPQRGVFKNCIIIGGGQWRMNAECSAAGCKYIGEHSTFFDYVGSDVNECVPADAQVFVEGSLYELTPEYAAKWIDEKDGSQIGLYGGPAPFTRVPSNPHIFKFDVASKTTADGKLTIDIEVNAPTR